MDHAWSLSETLHGTGRIANFDTKKLYALLDSPVAFIPTFRLILVKRKVSTDQV